MLHEAIHAYLLSQVDSADAGTINQTQFQESFSLLWEYYMDGLGSANQAQHETIAQLFVNTLANALKEWDNNSQSPQYYIDLAWGGLHETNIYLTTISLTDDDRDRIKDVNESEDFNETKQHINSLGETIITSPKGTLCP
ncbi:hypothetical protein N7U66_13270 [Lacinutrix neustonica]|uniref:Uncharacterized protein n=1 Tax=Lacinutrix neustonica TaxID=2980107 RepID=A0A9E8MU59_9FLAO|nr:hypothetical protein [Lacinutrix neustonica]WAC01126.1 hypothetical protein N7U66_13270 [Lacinutrix neustonica]